MTYTITTVQCRTKGCPKPSENRGWCKKHHDEWKRNAVVGDPGTEGMRKCAVETCNRIVWARGWCSAHLHRWQSTGDVQADVPVVTWRRPAILKPLTDLQIAWLAGWLEGEGCFDCNTKSYIKIRVSAKSTDEDVIDHVLAMTGIGHKYGEQPPNPNARYIYKWVVGVKADIVALIPLLLPLMHRRRQGRIIELIEGADWWSDFPPDFVATYKPES